MKTKTETQLEKEIETAKANFWKMVFLCVISAFIGWVLGVTFG